MKADMEKLIQDAAAGDEKAFSALYQQTFKRNYYIVLKMVKNEQDTQDILQDSYVKIYTHLKDYKHESEEGFAAWTSKIASNTALSHLRKKNPILFSDMETENDDGMAFPDLEDTSPDFKPEAAFDKKETAMIVQELLDSLSEEQRICILMFYLQDMSIKEIANQCGCSENTVKSRLNYGRKNIKKQGEELKKKGVKLYNVAPFPLFIYLLRKEAPDKITKKALLAGIGTVRLITGLIVLLVGISVGTGIHVYSMKHETKPVTSKTKLTATFTPLPKETAENMQQISEPNDNQEMGQKHSDNQKYKSKADRTNESNGDDKKSVTGKTESTKKPKAKYEPENTKKPKAAKSPASTKKPKATKKPKTTKKPQYTRKPTVTIKPKATKKPTVTTKPKATKKPTATKKPQKNNDSVDWDDDYVEWD